MTKSRIALLLALAFYMCNAGFMQTAQASETVQKFADVKINRYENVSGILSNAIIMCTKSSYAFVNGTRQKIDANNDDIMPVIVDGTLMLPVQFIAENIGSKIEWKNDIDTVGIKSDSTETEFVLEKAECTVNGKNYKLVAPARSMFGTIFIPVEAVSVAFNKKTYCDENGLIYISDSDTIQNTMQNSGFVGDLISSFGVYVSPGGSDNNNGILKYPFQTIERARDAIRGMKQKNGLPDGGITVYMSGGEYRLTKSVTLESGDTGSEEAPITYKAVPGEKVYITGAYDLPVDKFLPITNEKVKNRLYENVRTKVLQINLRDLGITDFSPISTMSMYTSSKPDPQSLFLDSVPQTLARWPNNDNDHTGMIISQGTAVNNGSIFQYEGKQPERWTKANDLWLRGFWMYDWLDENFKAVSIDTKEKTITLFDKTTFGIARGKPFYAYNLLEEIDMPGEYYLDRAKCILYYYPPKELSKSKVQLSMFEKPMVIINDCSNVNISGITFDTSCDTGIIMSNAKDNVVSDCVFRNLGNMAMKINKAENCGVKDCSIYNIGKGGVSLDGGDRATLTPGRNYVENCIFTKFSQSIKTYTAAISLHGCGNRISHNIIHDGPHMGIGFSGNDHLIEYNELYDLVKESNDAGAIYCDRDWTQRGTIIKNNIFHDIKAFTIYFDDSISGETVQSNLFYNCSAPIYVHGGRDFVIDSNIFANCGGMVIGNYFSRAEALNPSAELMVNYNAMPIHSDLWKKRYPPLINTIYDEPELAKYNVVTRTLSFNSKDFSVVKEAKLSGKFENNIDFTVDPGFVDAEHNVFKLSSEFNKIPGFMVMDYDNVGLYNHENRTSNTLSNFNIVYPQNGMNNVNAYKLQLVWQPSLGATKYRVTVAKDKYFNDIVFDKEAVKTNITVSDLHYGNVNYYWKVEPIGTSITNKYLNDFAEMRATFSTTSKEIVDVSELSDCIKSVENTLNTVKVGDAASQCPQQERDDFSQEIDNAKAIVASATSTQEQIDNEVGTLKSSAVRFNSSIKSGNIDLGMLISNKANWVAADASYIKCDGKTLNFTPGNSGAMAGTKNMAPNYAIWEGKAKFDLRTGWQGFGLRSGDRLSAAWDSSGYIVILKQDIFELHRFNSKPEHYPIVPNNGIVESGKYYDIEVGAIDIPNGVRIIFKVNGKTIYDYKDMDTYISDMGYFTLYGVSSCALELQGAGVKKAD